MTDARKPFADALRAAGIDFNRKGVVGAFDALMDVAGIPSATQATPAPASARKASAKGLALIHSFEGLRLTTYPDPGPTGLPVTGGWGTTRDENGKPFKLGRTEPQSYWDALFARDLGRFERRVADAVGSAPTTQAQFDAMVSFDYNTGAIDTATLTKKHKAGDYAGAAAEFARWNKAGGKVLNGLTRRRAAEAKMYRGEA